MPCTVTDMILMVKTNNINKIITVWWQNYPLHRAHLKPLYTNLFKWLLHVVTNGKSGVANIVLLLIISNCQSTTLTHVHVLTYMYVHTHTHTVANYGPHTIHIPYHGMAHSFPLSIHYDKVHFPWLTLPVASCDAFRLSWLTLKISLKA